jgi:hypothetical protein
MFSELPGNGALVVIYVISLAMLLAGIWIGHRLGAWRRRSLAGTEAGSTVTLQGSALALLGLMLGFTFAAAVSRFDTRKSIVLQEANAIGTALLRTDFLPAPYDKQAADLLKQYLTQRVAARGKNLGDLEIERALHRSVELHDQMWKIAVAATKAEPLSRSVGLYTQSLNDVIDLHTTRLAAARNHVPDSVIVMLFLLAMISMGLVAFDSVVQNKRGSGALVVTAILTAGVLAVVIDMDQPWLGFLVIDQAPLTDLLRSVGVPPKG